MKQIVVGQEGLGFLQSFLKSGNVLAQEALDLTGQGGQIITWLPDGVDLAQVSFRDGLGLGEKSLEEDIWRPIEEIASRFLDGESRRVIVLEASAVRLDEVADLVRTCSVSYDFHYILCDSGSTGRADKNGRIECGPSVSVLGYLTGLGKSSDQIADFLEQAFPYHQVIVFTSLSDHDSLVNGMRVSRNYVQQLVAKTEYIAIGAYDGSGVMLWDRHSVMAERHVWQHF